MLGHLTDAERGMNIMMSRIQDGHDGVSPDFDLDKWNARVVENPQAFTTTELTERMGENRQRLLKFITTLKDENWTKEGRHGS